MIDIQKFALLKLELAVFHRIYKNSKSQRIEPFLSKKVISFTSVNDDKVKFLKSELLKVIKDRGVSISFLDPPKSETPSIIIDIFQKFNNTEIKEEERRDYFLEKSKFFAKKLNEYHNLTMPGGILAILYGTIEVQLEPIIEDDAREEKKTEDIDNELKKHILIIAKIEEIEGLQAIQEENEIDIQMVHNLIWSRKANVMKVGVFYND